jgi:hypothetical protein
MPKKNDTGSPLGSHGGKGPLRDWSMGSYDQQGRSHSSIAEYGGKGPLHSNYVTGKCDPQIPSEAFRHIDKARSQSPQPVKHRPVTKRVE